MGDAAGFRKFSSFLVQYQFVTGRDNWNLLDNPDIMFISVKVARHVEDRVNRSVINMRRNSTVESCLSDLMVLINEETKLLSHSLFSRDTVSQYQEEKKYNQKKKVTTFLAKTEIQANESFELKAQKEEVECPVCGKSHGIEDCENFLKSSIEEEVK